MKIFNLYSLLTRWYTCAKEPPVHTGWYRVRTEPLSGAWWNVMGYFDGKDWWQYGTINLQAGNGLRVRTQLSVLQWQGLTMPATEAAALIREHLPRTPRIRERWLSYAKCLEEAPAPTTCP